MWREVNLRSRVINNMRNNFLILFFIAAVFSNCTKTATTTRHTNATPVATMPSPAGEQAANPALTAAAELVAQSAVDIENGKADSAEWNLEEAMRVAPNYGPAYYWMAKLKIAAGEPDNARSFLDKADSLSSQDSEMKIKINELRREIP